MSQPLPLARNGWLIAGGTASVLAATVHLGCIVGGPAWYRFFGAPERLARAAQFGSWRPTLFALGIALVLAIWAAYALAGAGLIARLPLMRPALVAISAIYLLRGLVIVRPALLGRPDLSQNFILWSSAIVFARGLVYAIGTWRAWRAL